MQEKLTEEATELVARANTECDRLLKEPTPTH